MKMADSLSSLYSSNLYTSKKAVTSSQNQFSQTVNNNLSTNKTSASGSVTSNASTSAKDLSFATSKTIESNPLFAVLSFTGSSFSIYKADDYTEENPTYLVIGKEKGKDFEITVNANDVKPDQASMFEMAAFQVHLKEKGVISNIELHPYKVDQNNYPVERSLFEKMNVISAYKEMYTRNLTNPRYDLLVNLGKIISAFDSLNTGK